MGRLGYVAVFAWMVSWISAGAGATVHPPASVANRALSQAPLEILAVASSSPIAAAWQRETGRSLDERVEAARGQALRLGSPGVEGAALWLLASPDIAPAQQRALLARRLAPDLPAAHAAVARQKFRSGSPGEALRAGWQAIGSLGTHLESRFWVRGSLWAIVTGTTVVGGIFFLLLVGLRCFPGAAHDLGDLVSPAMPEFSRVALLASLVCIPLALGESWAGVAWVLFAVGVAFGGNRTGRIALLAVLVLLLGLFPVAHQAGRNLVALGADPVASAARAVSLDREGPHDVAVLERASQGDSLAALALAVRARREGRVVEAQQRYSELLGQRPNDPVVLVNLANLHLEASESRRAIALYRRALAFGPSVPVLFNLAQAHARSFEVAQFDRVMARAQDLDANWIEALSNLGAQGLVVDVPISRETLGDRFLAAASGEGFYETVRQRVAPGLLGRGLPVAAALFAVSGALGLWLRSRVETSSRCRRCGTRICARCDGSVWNGRECDACGQVFGRPAATDTARRRARRTELEGRRRRSEGLGLAASWLVPGLGGVRQGRPDRGLVAVLLFFGSAFALVWMDGVVPGVGVVGGAGSAVLGGLGVGLGLLYAVVLLGSVRGPRRVEP